FTQKYPDISIELSNHEHVIDLLKEKVDLAIRVGNLEDSSLHAKLLMQSQLYMVASADYIKKYGMPKDIEAHKQHKCIGFSQLIKLNRWPIYDAEELYTITPQMSSTNCEVIRSLVLQGAGIGCLSEFLIAKDVEAGK